MTVGSENIQIGEDIFTAENGFHEITQETQKFTSEPINDNIKVEKKNQKGKGSAQVPSKSQQKRRKQQKQKKKKAKVPTPYQVEQVLRPMTQLELYQSRLAR